LTDYGKYKKYWKFYTAYFQKFTALPKIRQQESLFFSSKKGSFETMYCQDIQMFQHENI